VGDPIRPQTEHYFLDFEFDEDGRTIDPISLGMVTLGGRSLYIEFDFDERKVRQNEWVWRNVVPKLTWPSDKRLSISKARAQILEFVSPETTPSFFGFYADYDWVLFCRLFGRMVDLPSYFPHLCMDLQQWYVQLGQPAGVKPADPEGEHNALVDAMWNADFYRSLQLFVTTGARE